MGGVRQDRRRSVTNANNCRDTGSVASSSSGRRSNHKQRVSDSRRQRKQIETNERDHQRTRKACKKKHNSTNGEKMNIQFHCGESGITPSKSCCSNHESGDHSGPLPRARSGARLSLRGSVDGNRTKLSSDRPHSVDLDQKGETSCVNSTRWKLRASSTSTSTKCKSTIDNGQQVSS